jgi:hypothetical protein
MAQASEVFLFQPTSIPGCQLWLDAADRSTITLSGSDVTQWVDKASSLVFEASATRPTLAPRTYNNFLPIQFNGNSFLLNSSLSYNLNNRSGFMVVGETTLGDNDGFLSFAISGTDWNSTTAMVYSSGNKPLANQVFSPTQGFQAGGFALQVNGSTATPFGLYNDTFGSGSAFLYSNGTQAATTTNGTTFGNSTGLRLGARTISGSVANYLRGVIAEVVLYNRVVTTSERQQIEGYLAWKWGLQGSLPSNHPFKTYRPLAATPIPTSIPPMPSIGQTNQVFVPTQISGCSLWLDGADVSVLFSDVAGTSAITTNGQTIRCWKDKSGRGCNATQSGNAPIWNSSNYVNFTQTLGQFMNLPNGTLPFASGTNAYSIFAVANLNNTSGLKTIIGNGVNATNSFNALQIQSQSIGNLWFFNDINGGSLTANTFFIANIAFDGSTRYIYQTGTTVNTTASSGWAAPNSNNVIGVEPATGNWHYDGNIGEIIVYPNSLTTSQRQQVEGYLAWKWGLVSSLPNGHPYKVQQIAPFSFRTTPFRGSLNQWQPTQISGCQVWLDAADPSTLTLSGSSVTQWRDKSGQGYILTVPSGRVSPTYSNGVLNTTGAAALWTTTNFSISGNARVTLFLVYSTTTTAGLNGPGAHIGSANAATPPTYFGIVTYQTSSNAISFAPTVFEPDVYITLTPNTGGARMMACGFYTGSQINGTYNGTLLTPQTLTTANFGAQPFQIGLRTANNPASVDGTICESVCYNSALSTAQRQQVEGYLAWKWGLVGSLPANHPFRLFPPSP